MRSEVIDQEEKTIYVRGSKSTAMVSIPMRFIKILMNRGYDISHTVMELHRLEDGEYIIVMRFPRRA